MCKFITLCIETEIDLKRHLEVRNECSRMNTDEHTETFKMHTIYLFTSICLRHNE